MMQDFDPRTNMSLAKLILITSVCDPLPKPSNDDTALPPRQVADTLVDSYMTSIYPLSPAFSESALMARVDLLYDRPAQARRPMLGSDCWLVWLVLAIGSVAQSRSCHDGYYMDGVRYAAQALAHADVALAPGHATQIHCLLLLTQYAMFDPAHFDSWHLIGYTCSALIDLGYHKDPQQVSSANRAAVDARRRTFYCVYALNRFVLLLLCCLCCICITLLMLPLHPANLGC